MRRHPNAIRRSAPAAAALRLAALCCAAALHGVPASAHAGAAAMSRLEAIREARVLRVCIWLNSGEVSFRDRQSGEIQGMDADLARDLAKDLGVALSFEETDPQNLPEELDRGRCDVAMGGIGITAPRAARMRFTKPIVKSDHYAVVSSFAALAAWTDLDQPGTAVGIRAGMEEMAGQRLRKARIVTVAPPYTLEGELEAGRVDAYLANFSMARHARRLEHGTRVLTPDKPFAVTAYGFAAKPGDDAWVARLDAFVDAIRRDGRLDEVAQRWGFHDLIVKS